MKVREAMSTNPVCCLRSDTAQKVARILCEHNIGSVPVVEDQQSRKLIGMITDRDLCCSVVAEGLDPKRTSIERFVSLDLVTCRDGDNLEKCERAMQKHQIRRIPVVDGEDHCIGIVSQADLALKDKPERVSRTVAEISKPEAKTPSVAA
jgi:CBS domain-containing protein